MLDSKVPNAPLPGESAAAVGTTASAQTGRGAAVPDVRVAAREGVADDRPTAEVARRPRPSPVPVLPPLPQLRPGFPAHVPAEPEAREADISVPRIDELQPLPRLAPKRGYGARLSFLLCVVLPTALLAFYLWCLASDQYEAEFRFSVIQSTPVLPGTSSASLATASQQSDTNTMASLMSSMGGSSALLTSAAPQNFIVTDYLLSPQAVAELQKQADIVSLYQKPEIDWWSRFGAHRPIEKFLSYLSWYVYTDYDQVTGLAVAKVRAFSAHDAWLIASTMAKLSEGLINKINERANQDAVRFAAAEVDKAKAEMNKVNTELLDFRTTEGTVNPSTTVVPTNTQLVQNVLTNLISLQTQLSATVGTHLDNGPVIRSLQSQIAAAKQQLQQVESQVAHDQQDMRALAKLVGKYEQLTFDQTYWENMLTQTMQALELARANAAAQHLYLEPYVLPAVPQSATYPQRPLLMLIGFLVCFGAWLAGLLIIRAIRDHAA